MAPLWLAAALLAACVGADPYRRLQNTDITPCIDPCVRVGNCGYDTPNPKCNITLIEQLCNTTCGCVAFNSNGWLKGCGNTSCGIQFEGASGTDSYIRGDGMPNSPSAPVAPVEDVYYPSDESDAQPAPAVSAASVSGQWAVISFEQSAGVNISVGQQAFGFVLLAVLDGSPVVAVLERSFQRLGFVVYVEAQGSEVGRLRKGTGEVHGLDMPNYNVLVKNDCTYYAKVAGGPADYLAARIVNDTRDGEATYLAAVKYMAPQRDYAIIGAVAQYQKYSVSPDGRIKSADDAIYTPDAKAEDTGPGKLVWDPRTALPAGTWPPSNFTFLKSALLGGLRVVIVTAFEPSTETGFEQVAFGPSSESSPCVYVRLRAVKGPETLPFQYSYYNVSANRAASSLSAENFYTALALEQAAWNKTFAPAAAYTIPGTEGLRQIDTARGALIASLTLYVGLQPNYGDGADYWSPQVDRGGSLPFQEIAVVQNLIDVGLADMAADRLGWWMDHYINADGSISTGNWELSCPFHFADGFADYGEMIDMFVRVARLQVGRNGTAWIAQHIGQAARLVNYTYTLRLAAKKDPSTKGTPAEGLIWGPPEHDTCHSPGYYYHNQAWFIRGLREAGKFFGDVCPVYCPSYASMGPVYLAEAVLFQQDFINSLNRTVTVDSKTGKVVFVPPIAQLNFAPFHSMIESTVAEYSNFRYFSELLGADVLPLEWSIAVQEFRENTFGTVSGITRWSDHLDDMPSSYYLATSLRDDRLQRFFLLQYGHMANYMGRGTYTATEQLPIAADANGFYRDYLWSYLEGGIDECVPSIMLPAIATRWQFVLERYDTDVLWLAKGAPRRWAAPAGKGYGVANALTRFGWVDIAITNQLQPPHAGEFAIATVSFTPLSVPATTQTPQLALRLRSYDPSFMLDASSVTVKSGNVVVASVDVDSSIVLLNITQSPGTGQKMTFVVTAWIAPN